jgi:hypothetical protein
MSTLGWKQRAALGADGIGFVQKRYKRYLVPDKKAGEACTKELWD